VKPAPFTYHRPETLEEAVRLLAEFAPQDGRVLAGGQSLVPMMNLRLARPAFLIDINAVAGLDRLAVEDGLLRIGARVRHAAFDRPLQPGPLTAMLADVARHIGHYPIRIRGTFCGSLANADPAAEWCLVAATLDAGSGAPCVIMIMRPQPRVFSCGTLKKPSKTAVLARAYRG
jgi:carbon-monoxide dehydrogenase medium subunit